MLMIRLAAVEVVGAFTLLSVIKREPPSIMADAADATSQSELETAAIARLFTKIVVMMSVIMAAR